MQNHKPKFLKKLSDIIPETTAHGFGEKFVFRKNEEMPNASKQVAYGHFKVGEACEEHTHPTMDEYFFFISGEGTCIIEGVEYPLTCNTFLEISAGKKHSFHADKNKDLQFVYWGIATE